jgi:uncharacterized membrane protein
MLLVGLLILMGGLFHIIPGFTRPDIFFVVTVAPEFRRSSDAQRILRRYRAMVWMTTLVASWLELATGLAAAVVLLEALGFLGALVATNRAVRAYAAAPNSMVEVDLAMPQERLPGGPIVAILPVLSLGSLGLWAGFHWDRLPPRFPVHFGLHGADRWVTTTPTTVFGFLAMVACMCLLLAGLAWGIVNWTRRISTAGCNAAAERHFRRRVAQLSIVSAYFLVFPAWLTLFHPAAAAMNVWGLAMATVLVAFTVNLMRGGQGGSRATVTAGGAPVGDRTPDACWKWGLCYVNAADPSILIEKRFGVGYTLNFGNRWTWVVLALLLAPVAAGLILLR